jgi:prepilin-type N-terminal cleavage/methylation domain-containing protein
MITNLKKYYNIHSSNGFTLLEFLVVISIIAVLIGILTPSLQQVRAYAKQVTCQMRLKQWGVAFESYAVGNQNVYPHIDGRDRCGDSEPISPEGKIDYYYGWVDVVSPLMGQRPWRDFAKYQYPGTDTIYQCPAANLLAENEYDYRPQRNGFFSYAMNSCLELDANCWPPYYPYPDPEGARNDMPSLLKTTLIRQPSQVFLLFDQLLDPKFGYNAQKLNRSAGQHCGAYPREFSNRHQKGKEGLGGFILCCDYHIEWKQSVWKDTWPRDLEVPLRSDTNWFPY